MKSQTPFLKSLFFFFFLFSFIMQHSSFNILFAQAPQKFNYQAVAREGNTVLDNITLDARFEILQGSPTGEMVWSETQTGITTNDYGLFSIYVGSEIEISINWNEGPYFLKVEVDMGNGFQEFGNSELLSVPYALNTKSVSLLENLDIRGPEDMNPDSALFEVKRNDGQTIFAVYNSGVRMFVEEGTGKGGKGGFAIGGFTPGKGETGEYFRVTPDSVRIYLDNSDTKGGKGGFAIGGFTPGKDNETVQEYLRVTEDSTRIYIDNTATKGRKGGFAIGGFTPGKGNSIDFLNLTPENYFIGHESGKSITGGLYNSFLGYQSGLSTTDGSNNALFGYQAGYNNITGSGNLFLGYQTGFSNVAGNYNSFLGYHAGYSNTTGAHNTFLGSFSGYTNVEGRNNTFIGDSTGFYNLDGINNTFLGTGCGKNNTSGTSNIFIGNKSGFGNKYGESNVYIGDRSGYSNISGELNVYIGHLAGFSSNGDWSNVFIGHESGYSTTISQKNVFIGTSTGRLTTWGSSNVYIGVEAGENNSTGSDNVCIGVAAGSKSSASDNVFLGYAAGWDNTSGASNVFLGTQAGWSNTTGANNIFIGGGTGYTNETGSGNIFIGRRAGWSETGSDKLYIDNTSANYENALIWGDFNTNQLRFNGSVGINGEATTSWALSINMDAGDNYGLVVYGPTYCTEGAWAGSDKRLKKNIKTYDGALDKVLKMRAVNFNWRANEFPSRHYKNSNQIGVIAQEVEKVIPELVNEGPEGYKSVDYSKMSAVLIEAIKEQQKQIEELKAENVELAAKINNNSKLEAELAELKAIVEQISQQQALYTQKED